MIGWREIIRGKDWRADFLSLVGLLIRRDAWVIWVVAI